MKPGPGSKKKLFASDIDKAVDEAVALRSELRSRPIRDIHDVEAMANLDERARPKLQLPELIADALVGEALLAPGKSGKPPRCQSKPAERPPETSMPRSHLENALPRG